MTEAEIDLYTWSTPNGRKPPILLEELGLTYKVHLVDIGAGEQKRPEFLRLNPNGKIPALVDHQPAGGGGPVTVFESGAILQYLAETHGRFLPAAGPGRWTVLAWLHWQIGGLGPMLGQLGAFTVHAKAPNPGARERYAKEARRLLEVMDTRLGEARYLGGDDYSIADIASYTWTRAFFDMLAPVAPEAVGAHRHVDRWLAEVGSRPAVQRGMRTPPDQS